MGPRPRKGYLRALQVDLRPTAVSGRSNCVPLFLLSTWYCPVALPLKANSLLPIQKEIQNGNGQYVVVMFVFYQEPGNTLVHKGGLKWLQD